VLICGIHTVDVTFVKTLVLICGIHTVDVTLILLNTTPTA